MAEKSDIRMKVTIEGIEKVNANLDKLLKNIDKLKQNTGKAAKATSKLAKAFKVLATVGVAGVVAGTYGLIKAGKSLVKAHNLQERANKQLNTLLKITTVEYNKATKAALKYSKILERQSVVNDAIIVSGAGVLASYQITYESIQKLLPGLVDLATYVKQGARVMKEDMFVAANNIARALIGLPGLLRRSGISMSNYQEEAMKAGNEQERVAVLAKVLKQNVGGLSRAMRNTAEGAMHVMENAWMNLKEKMGSFATKLTPLFLTIAEFFESDAATRWANKISYAFGIAVELAQKLATSLPTGTTKILREITGVFTRRKGLAPLREARGYEKTPEERAAIEQAKKVEKPWGTGRPWHGLTPRGTVGERLARGKQAMIGYKYRSQARLYISKMTKDGVLDPKSKDDRVRATQMYRRYVEARKAGASAKEAAKTASMTNAIAMHKADPWGKIKDLIAKYWDKFKDWANPKWKKFQDEIADVIAKGIAKGFKLLFNFDTPNKRAPRPKAAAVAKAMDASALDIVNPELAKKLREAISERIRWRGGMDVPPTEHNPPIDDLYREYKRGKSPDNKLSDLLGSLINTNYDFGSIIADFGEKVSALENDVLGLKNQLATA